jgi:hypothetical protein
VRLAVHEFFGIQEGMGVIKYPLRTRETETCWEYRKPAPGRVPPVPAAPPGVA